MRCVSYTRAVSCIPEDMIPKDIIGQQNARIQEFARSRGWKISEKYSDRKKDAEEDASFREMKADGMERKFDCVVVDSIFRCGRNFHAAQELFCGVFYPAGIQFAVAEDGFYSGGSDERAVQEYFGRKRTEFQKKITLPGMLRHIQDRVYKKYGYRIDRGTGELAVDPVSSEIIKRIFQMAAEGTMPGEIAKAMTSERNLIPSVYQGLAKKGIPEADQTRWSATSVKVILRNKSYMGYYERLADGALKQVGCPAIVGQELFEKAQGVFRTRKQGKAKPAKQQALNPLSGRVKDKETGHRLSAGRLVPSGERVYRFRYPEPAGISYEKRYIRCDDVMEAVAAALREEKEKAAYAREMLRTGRGDSARQERLLPYRKRLKEIFFEMAGIESRNVPAYLRWQAGEIPEDMYREQYEANVREVERLETVFQQQLGKLDEIDLAFSEKNPWIRLYADIEKPEEMTSAQAGKWLECVEVAQFESAEAVMKEQEAFSMLPAEWFADRAGGNGGNTDGTEKQEKEKR